jgi:succinate-semialdehyde dehydrogenase/glutarate-semialdehyde dehydrogenase
VKSRRLEVPEDFPLLKIGGTWRASGDGATRPVINPATEAEIGTIPVATSQDLEQAAQAAGEAFKSWKHETPIVRSAILRKAASLLRAADARIAPLITRENGKTLAEAKAEVHWACDYLEWFAEEGRRAYGRVIPAKFPGTRQMVIKEPIGPVLGLSPWNWPLVTACRKVGPALAAGCTIVLKPAEETPSAPAILVKALEAAGCPDGVVNLVYGEPSQISEELIANPEIRKITFTGSVPVGRHLAVQAAQRLKPITLELGGHAPVLVFNDADIEATVAKLIPFKFRTCGQVCSSPTRFLVQNGIAGEFAAAFAVAAAKLTVGNGADDGVDIGPLVTKRRLDAVTALVEDATRTGAQLIMGGNRLGTRGYFFEPTILNNVPDDARILEEEPFGPIVPIQTFETYEEAVAMANHPSLGLSAYAFTDSLTTAQNLSRDIVCGMLGINTLAVSTSEAPFGGVRDSGMGAEGGIEGLDVYLQTKFVVEAAS